MPAAQLPISRILTLSRDDGFTAAVDALYAALEERIASRRPLCLNRGDCCKFAVFGHRLFVTPVELAYFVAKVSQPPAGDADPGSCPYQIAGRCNARQGRPAGCRIFFCDEADQGWQSQETEATLGAVKELHTRLDLPYAYVEWLEALHLMEASRAQL